MNFATCLQSVSRTYPYKRAVVFAESLNKNGYARYSHITYEQFEKKTSKMAHFLRRLGISRGMRVSFMVKSGLDFLPLIYALFAIGAIPVLIDPGMGKKNLFRCISRSKPKAFIGIPLACFLRFLFPAYFRTVKLYISTGNRAIGGERSLKEAENEPQDAFLPVDVADGDSAAIIFTTGSTGPPKGVIYTHRMFQHQVTWLQEQFGITQEDIDLPGFPLFAIFSIAIGMTVILPEMDPTRPAKVKPQNIIQPIHDHGVTFSFGSPALWNTVSRFCEKKHILLPSLKQVIMAGAPIPPFLHERLHQHILSKQAEIYTPYGATESLLVSCFTGKEVLAKTATYTRKGKGYCVGYPLPSVQLKIMEVSDTPIKYLHEIREVHSGTIGEIIVQSPVVSPGYFDQPEQDKVHKIFASSEKEDQEIPWHRMGDLGYLDEQERLWFCGRKNHRVETENGCLYTVCCEAVFNEHPDIFRSALVGIGKNRYNQQPILIVEPVEGKFPHSVSSKAAFKKQLLAYGKKASICSTIDHILFHKSFPVDIRHNAKIFREKLAAWASRLQAVNFSQ